MTFSDKPVTVVKRALLCAACGKEMVFGGKVLTSYPPQYPHKCPGCGYVEHADKYYPSIEFLS